MKTPHFWKSRNALSNALLPLSWLYGMATTLHRCTTRPQRAALPVISIGNITAGGAGKTPTTLALVPLLRTLGHTPHILTRGYGGAALTAHRVTASDNWRIVGDEALLLAQAAPTWVGRDRLASARAAAQQGATVLLCDDALQHHRLHRDLSLLVVDGPYGFGNGRLLPAGPLREPLHHALARCTATVVIGDSPSHTPHALASPVFHGTLQPVATETLPRATQWLAFAGIGRPQKFYDTLKGLGLTLVETHDFADHHAYREEEISRLIARAAALGATAITTEKDAVKLPEGLRNAVATLKVSLVFADEMAVKQWLESALPARRSA